MQFIIWDMNQCNTLSWKVNKSLLREWAYRMMHEKSACSQRNPKKTAFYDEFRFMYFKMGLGLDILLHNVQVGHWPWIEHRPNELGSIPSHNHISRKFLNIGMRLKSFVCVEKHRLEACTVNGLPICLCFQLQGELSHRKTIFILFAYSTTLLV